MPRVRSWFYPPTCPHTPRLTSHSVRLWFHTRTEDTDQWLKKHQGYVEGQEQTRKTLTVRITREGEIKNTYFKHIHIWSWWSLSWLLPLSSSLFPLTQVLVGCWTLPPGSSCCCLLFYNLLQVIKHTLQAFSTLRSGSGLISPCYYKCFK